MASAILLLINIIGLGFGPWAVGIQVTFCNNLWKRPLRWSLCFFSLLNIWAGYHFYRAGLRLAEDKTLFETIQRKAGITE